MLQGELGKMLEGLGLDVCCRMSIIGILPLPIASRRRSFSGRANWQKPARRSSTTPPTARRRNCSWNSQQLELDDAGGCWDDTPWWCWMMLDGSPAKKVPIWWAEPFGSCSPQHELLFGFAWICRFTQCLGGVLVPPHWNFISGESSAWLAHAESVEWAV